MISIGGMTFDEAGPPEPAAPETFEPVEVAYRVPGHAPKRKVCKTRRALDALLAKLEDEGGETLAFARLS